MNKRNLIQISIAIIVLMLLQLACVKSISNLISSITDKVTTEEATTEETEAIVVQEEDEVAQPVTNADVLSVVDYGFGQFGTTVGYGIMVQNPNSDAAIVGTEFQISFYDANGTVVETDTDYLDFVFPSELVGVAGEVYLDEGITVDRIEVVMDAGDAETTNYNSAFTVAKETMSRDEYSTYAVAEVYNPYDERFDNFIVSAIFFDAQDKIVGGGYGYNDFISAHETVGVQISGTSSEEAARAMVFVNMNSYSYNAEDLTIPSDAQEIELVDTGFAQGDYSVGHSIVLYNPDPQYAITDSMYHVTFYSANQDVLGYLESYVSKILPGEKLGVANDAYLAIEDTVDSAVIQFLPGTYEIDQEHIAFTTQNAAFIDDSYWPSITGEVVNPYTQQVTDLEVTAIAYDANDNIIGSGWTYMDFVPASSTAAVEIYITVVGEPAYVEIYAALSAFSEFE